MHRTVTPEMFAAYMQGVIEFAPDAGLDALQWSLIKDMTSRVALTPPAPPRTGGCGCADNPPTTGH